MKKKIGIVEVIAGMALVLAGQKKKGLLTFAHGFYALEQNYQKNNPHLQPGLKARWREAVRFYDATHQEETNRTLHRWGIPVILAGAIGLLLAKPYQKPWWIAAVAFAVGWGTNIVGHGKYEKNRPAFTEDPLSFVAGPVWDLQQLRQRKAVKHHG